MSPADQPDIDPVLADAVRRAYVRPVDEDTARRHVSAMLAAAASAGTEPATSPARPPRRLWRPVLAAGAATLLAPVGLAVAGVSLPNPVEEPYRAVGIELPHQERDVDRAPAPALLPPATPPSPSAAPPTAAPRRPADERPGRPRSARPARGRGNRLGNRTGQTRRQNETRRPDRSRSAAPRPERARPTGSARPNRSAGPTENRSKPKRPK